jgi:hypothetical protein
MRRSGRDEPIQIVIYTCMEAKLGISLYRYSYLKLAKKAIFLIIAYVFSSTKLEKRAEQVLPGNEGDGGRERGARGRREKWPKQCMDI